MVEAQVDGRFTIRGSNRHFIGRLVLPLQASWVAQISGKRVVGHAKLLASLFPEARRCLLPELIIEGRLL